MDTIINKLCSIQGRLFELAVIKGYDSEAFIYAYMKSDIARHFNSKYDGLQWMGEEYILDLIEEKYSLPKGYVYSVDVMFWIGYMYCYWHYRTFHSCIDIIKIASPKIMFQNYYALHTIDKDLVIENLMQLSINEKQNKVYKEIFKHISKQQIDNLNITEIEKEYRKILIDKVAEKYDQQLKEKSKQNNYIKLNNEIGEIRLSYIQFIIDLIDESNWSFEKKIEYKLIIDKIKDKIIKYGFNKDNYSFMEKVYNELL